MSFSDQDIAEFKAEARELLDTAEKGLLSLDQGGDFKSAFDSIFRGFHNLKGAAGMMELPKLQAHTHELESLLMKLKTEGAMPAPYISLFLRGVDAARSLLEGQDIAFVYSVGEDDPASAPAPAITHVIVAEAVPAPTRVTASAPAAPASPAIPQAVNDEFVAECGEIVERVAKNLQLLEKGNASKDNVDALYRDVHSLKGSAYLFSYTKLGDLGHGMESSLERVRAGTHKPSAALFDQLYKCLALIEQIVKNIAANIQTADLDEQVPLLAARLLKAAEALESVQETPVTSTAPSTTTAAQANESGEGAASIRVPVSLLDNLMTLMGEMVLVRNQVLQYANRSDDLELLSMSKRLNVVTGEIQGEMMKTRMQPIGNVLTKFNRVVRDLSQELRKNITLNIIGAETELDKSLLEAIKDPLTHIVRNSCDHGIETPEVRREKGKRDVGTISVRSYHEGGQVVVEVSDDGKGLHKEMLLNKAVERGLITPAQAASLGEKEIYNLIFAPGFSTAAAVTNVSGRGVGMDVVRTNIERIGGTVDLTSRPGAGTTIKLKIPLTLAIVPALIVRCGLGKFAVPQVKLEELVRVDQSSADNHIEILHGTPVYRLRGNILPLVDLNRVLKGNGGDSQPDPAKYKDAIVNIAVLNAEQFSFGLIIDEIQDSADIVVKPLTRLMKSLQVYSGATILGDGSVALILDVLGISKVANLKAEKIREVTGDQKAKENIRLLADAQDFLLVKVNATARHALAMAYVNRLEEFKSSEVEYSGNQRLVRYRDSILPLISANQQLGLPDTTVDRATIPVVVIEKAGVLYGIEVDGIVDTLSTQHETRVAFKKQNGIFGNINTADELIVVMDPFEMIETAFPNMARAKFKESNASGKRVLLVEDTAFFRRNIKKVLEERGYEVVTAGDGEEALSLMGPQHPLFDIIVSDIEMPKVNGFQLAASVRSNPHLAGIPMLAVSSRADKGYLEQGARAGFNLYLEKLKPDILLEAVERLLMRNAA